MNHKKVILNRELWLSVLMAWVLTFPGRTRAGSIVTVNADKVLLVNGQKEFLIGFSPGPPNHTTMPTGKDALQEFREAGALLFRIAQSTAWDATVISNQQVALDWAAQHGMYCWVNLRELSQFPSTDTNTPASLRNIVDLFRDHPALGLWKNYDEAWWAGVSATNLLNGYSVIKQEDTNHPVVQTHAPRGTVADLQPYNVAADILALDIYPVTASGSASNPPITNTAISQVGDWTKVLSQVANGQKEYWMIEQIAFSGTTPPNKIMVFPTFTQSRFMAYQAIVNGARGLLFYGGNIAATLNAQDAPYGWNWTFWTNVLKRVVLELGDHSQLANALVAPESTLQITMGGTVAPEVEYCVREVPPYLYLLATKREGPTTNVTFSGLPSWAHTGEVLYESPRTVTAWNGQFSDSFAPHDVHVYRFYQPGHITLYEPFDYSNVGGPVSSNTPANWTYGGSPPNDLSVVNGSLSYPGLATSVGNSVTNGGAGLGVRRLFGTSVQSGTLYFSALFRINDLGFGAWNGGATTVGALTGTNNTAFQLAVLVKSNSPSGYVVGVQKSGPDATAVFDTTEHHAGETLFLVGKYDFTQTPNPVSLWIDPSPTTLDAVFEPTTGYISTSTGTNGLIIDRFNMRQNTTSSVPAAMQWDELRVGFSWAEVTPTPPSVVTSLTDLTQLGNGAFQFGFTNSSGQGYSVYGSTNLTIWSPIGAATQVSPGLFQFTDPDATNYPQRFYQLRSP